ncbi:carbonic anhydrase [Gloeopeniophorella convolvens]|nr:carbonic anhydrase [Gloeopeniophorella convolvens]
MGPAPCSLSSREPELCTGIRARSLRSSFLAGLDIRLCWSFRDSYLLVFNMSSPLSDLLAANESWASAVFASDQGFFDRGVNIKQTPKFLWIGCADSRLPASVMTSSKPGDMFVHRNIAGLVHPDDENVLATISLAIELVHVEHILVVSHTRCGGTWTSLNAVLGKETVPPPAPVLNKWLAPLIDLAKSLHPSSDPDSFVEEWDKLAEASVRQQFNNVVNTETVKRAWESGKKLSVHALIYDVATGRLRDLGITRTGSV